MLFVCALNEAHCETSKYGVLAESNELFLLDLLAFHTFARKIEQGFSGLISVITLFSNSQNVRERIDDSLKSINDVRMQQVGERVQIFEVIFVAKNLNQCWENCENMKMCTSLLMKPYIRCVDVWPVT